ncbi:phytoene desaturase [Candidatus Methylopumilus planktonicus]|uniref:phytoene desaturase family protein n=1 Tax=Candidatus Methylopumilus TaxID=1679002 RepID=UPI00111CBE3A|nr:phytoene desaturase family protein [Candidatus Methylopumilus planktonicus]QDD00173.1 phytoene desaturase [Candidatus Methylopumilus planktonicus]QDD01497.1 phytoene desaturase [Candidatus Methylopumilus planktonicus]QDD06793.1 phytoene desaturase [Candidatus Methylopumilus planktonicus]QDD08129.1 phytoene desaturase [Candidatus Methylopumilus planktonicus]QDD09455.1 phytoene desaturase [Candidatus Methylopumilus planktonicus]
MQNKKIIVIGSGFGGIAAALRMRAKGYEVDLHEKLDQIGGRARQFSRNGFVYDAGPTVITAPYLFRELFEIFNEDIDDFIKFIPLDPWYRFRFNDGTFFNYGPDQDQLLEQIKAIEPKDVNGYLKMLQHAEKIFEVGYLKLADQPFHKLSSLIKYTPDIIKLKGYQSVYQFVSSYLKHPNLRQAFSIQPLLVGGNPFNTTSIYALIHALEKKWGVFFAKGGTGEIISQLKMLMERKGINIFLNSEIKKIITSEKMVEGIETEESKFYKTDYLITNADPIYTNSNLIGRKKISLHNKFVQKTAKHSMGLFVLFFGTKAKYDNIAHHTIWMGPRYKELLSDIFDRYKLSEDFSIYLHRPTATDPDFAPIGCDSFYALVPVPNLKGNISWKDEASAFTQSIIKALEQTMMPKLSENICESFVMTPEDFLQDYNTPFGSGFSIAPLFRQSAWFRTHNKDDLYQNLFYVGAGTHPGAGVPGVLNSAKVIDKLIP